MEEEGREGLVFAHQIWRHSRRWRLGQCEAGAAEEALWVKRLTGSQVVATKRNKCGLCKNREVGGGS